MRTPSQKSERKRTPRAGRPHQVERFDSKTITIPLPSEKLTGESEEAWASGWPSRKRQMARDPCGDVVAFHEDRGADGDIVIKEQELKKARDTIRKKQSLAVTKKFDPATIIAECERMMEVLRREGCGDENVNDVDKEIERLKREADHLLSLELFSGPLSSINEIILLVQLISVALQDSSAIITANDSMEV
uniref:CWF21 domain-containing protein n=1 Tax=Angiostrongylus cantonensis TaxID=6313 RepID=A0A158PA73_ANGCA